MWEHDLVIDSITSQVSVHLVLFPNRDLNGAFSSSCGSHDNVLAPSSAPPQISAMSKAQSFKAKVRSKFLPAETKERLALARSTTVDSLQLIFWSIQGACRCRWGSRIKGRRRGSAVCYRCNQGIDINPLLIVPINDQIRKRLKMWTILSNWQGGSVSSRVFSKNQRAPEHPLKRCRIE